MWEDLEYIITPQVNPEDENANAPIPDYKYGYITSVYESKINKTSKEIILKGHTEPIYSKYSKSLVGWNSIPIRFPKGPKTYPTNRQFMGDYGYVFAGYINVQKYRFGENIIGIAGYKPETPDMPSYYIAPHIKLLRSEGFGSSDGDNESKGYRIVPTSTDFNFRFKYELS